MTRFSSKLKYAGLVTGLSMTCTQLNAANYGTDLNLTMMPASGGMGGVGIARPQDTGSAVFGNPASLTQFNGTHFMFGATFYAQDVDALHDGTTTGTAWSGESDAGPYLIPSIAIAQSLNDRVTLGLGLGVVAGIGSDFRKVPGSWVPWRRSWCSAPRRCRLPGQRQPVSGRCGDPGHGIWPGGPEQQYLIHQQLRSACYAGCQLQHG